MAVTQRHHVAAGSFIICERKPMVLQAYLGTCVGLALYCGKTGLGGMIHLLLPAPVSSSSSVLQPEKYASTGVPLLLDSLLAKGAHLETLSASIAGGALVGPLSQQDLSLDIGGHTADTVRDILAGYHIAVARSETGGFFTSCLSLNMSTGQCAIEPAGQNKLIDQMEIKIPTSAEIKKAMDRLQPIPQVALKILRMINEGQEDLDQIAAEIRKDQVISARTLALANSALFAKRRPIESLDQALLYLGQEQLVKLVLSIAVQSYFEQSAMGYSLCKGGLYHHAIGCALVAEALAVKTKKVDPAIAYISGLLHDIGKVVLDQYVAQGYPFFYRQVMEKGENVSAIEKRLLGIDHTEVGHLLAQQWALPDSLTHVIRFHHQPDKEGEHKALTAIVYMADLLLSRFHIGVELERVDTHALVEHLKSIDLTIDHFSDLVDLIPDAVFRTTIDTSSVPA